MTTPTPDPKYATIKAHAAPQRALWHGADKGTPSPAGEPCSIRAVAGGWIVQVDGMRPWHVSTRSRVWLADAPADDQAPPPPTDAEQHVINPSPVPIKLDTPTMSAYRALSAALTIAANACDASARNAGAAGDVEMQRAELSVRDGLRRAATEALVPAGPTRAPRCRRCSISCPHCSAAAGDAGVPE